MIPFIMICYVILCFRFQTQTTHYLFTVAIHRQEFNGGSPYQHFPVFSKDFSCKYIVYHISTIPCFPFFDPINKIKLKIIIIILIISKKTKMCITELIIFNKHEIESCKEDFVRQDMTVKCYTYTKISVLLRIYSDRTDTVFNVLIYI